ncbi:hypothetical protein JTE90_018223 [Oedothorax gibbosus]|uniref:Uncharacterized protein n=1 Tax=Oedothorax gibbosus TaxID=931172 RepID=A0AAV6UAN8_9ARAC|nr:hypothetical protein JTE90_018223 [Oedothorax gibbosus]
MKSNEILIHVDFRENYACKYANEIQTIHFVGGQQITLHTGMLYWKDESDVIIPESFCTLSDSLGHNAAAIWAHLHPVIQNHLKAHPNVDTIHGMSDSPSNQYRNKTMFYIISTVLKEDIPRIKRVTWNYTEAGHGKGAPDGIGGVLKRTADRIVAQGADLANYHTLFEAL